VVLGLNGDESIRPCVIPTPYTDPVGRIVLRSVPAPSRTPHDNGRLRGKFFDVSRLAGYSSLALNGFDSSASLEAEG
jgi:hypothetical protein